MNLFNTFKYLFKSGIKPQGMYAVTRGQHMGQFYVFIDHNPKAEDKYFKVLQIPDNIALYIKKEDIDLGIKYKVLDRVSTLSDKVYTQCVAEFHDKNNTGRVLYSDVKEKDVNIIDTYKESSDEIEIESVINPKTPKEINDQSNN